MQTLDYQVPQSRSLMSPAVCFLIALPIISAGYAFLSAANWVGEPFGVVEAADVVLFFGAPLFAIGSAVAWSFIARRRRLRWPVIALALGFFALMSYWSMESLLPYFQEPWNNK
jgi:hypothetical protein